MKIIEHGKFYQKIIIGKCNICGCTFEVEKDDDNLFYKLMQMENGQNELKLSAHCPECKGDANVEIKEKRKVE